MGVPGLTSWTSVIPARASAFCWVTAPATVAGAMAPARVKGVTMTGWPCSAMAIMPSSIGVSKRSGEFALTTVTMLGSDFSFSRDLPLAIEMMDRPSSILSGPSE